MFEETATSRELRLTFDSDTQILILEVQRSSALMMNFLRENASGAHPPIYPPLDQTKFADHPGRVLAADVASILSRWIECCDDVILKVTNDSSMCTKDMESFIETLIRPWLHAFAQLMLQSILAIKPGMRAGPSRSKLDKMVQHNNTVMDHRSTAWMALGHMVDRSFADTATRIPEEHGLVLSEEMCAAFLSIVNEAAEHVKDGMGYMARIVESWMKAYLLGDDRDYIGMNDTSRGKGPRRVVVDS